MARRRVVLQKSDLHTDLGNNQWASSQYRGSMDLLHPLVLVCNEDARG